MTTEPNENTRELEFLSGAYARIVWCSIIAGVVALPVSWGAIGFPFATGFLLGWLLGIMNSHWLRRLVDQFAAVSVDGRKATSPRRMVGLFLLRYAFIALVAYAIFESSINALNGLFAGLLVPVFGILCEAAIEIFHSVKQSSF